MRTKEFIFAAVVVFCGALSICIYGARPADTSDPDAGREPIDRQISDSYRAIDNYYNRRIYILQVRAERSLASYEASRMAKLYENALHYDDFRYVPAGYVVAEYGPMISRHDIAEARALIEAEKERLASRLERMTASLEEQREYQLEMLDRRAERLSAESGGPISRPTNGRITGVITSKDMKLAVMDGRLVGAGDTVGGVKVVGVSSSGVEFEKNGERWTRGVGEKAE